MLLNLNSGVKRDLLFKNNTTMGQGVQLFIDKKAGGVKTSKFFLPANEEGTEKSRRVLLPVEVSEPDKAKFFPMIRAYANGLLPANHPSTQLLSSCSIALMAQVRVQEDRIFMLHDDNTTLKMHLRISAERRLSERFINTSEGVKNVTQPELVYRFYGSYKTAVAMENLDFHFDTETRFWQSFITQARKGYNPNSVKVMLPFRPEFTHKSDILELYAFGRMIYESVVGEVATIAMADLRVITAMMAEIKKK
jgi:hypothetical protein